jgi:hypothetical protein
MHEMPAEGRGMRAVARVVMATVGLTSRSALILGVGIAGAAAALGPAVAVAQVERPFYRVYALGDSFASGEGAPGTDGSYNQHGLEPDPRAVWSGTATDRAFTGDVETGLRGARRCHRSPRATAPKAAKLLRTRFPDVQVAFRSFACSGARLDFGGYGPYVGLEGDNGKQIKDTSQGEIPSQIAQLDDAVATLPASSRRIDALVMNIGGNNLGFADIITTCLGLDIGFGRFLGTERCSPSGFQGQTGSDRAKTIFETGSGSGGGSSSIGLDDLPRHFAEFDDRLDGDKPGLAVRPRDIFLSGPPPAIAGGLGACSSLTGPYDFENRIEPIERDWLVADVFPRFVNAMAEGASRGGWNFVDMSTAFANGLCGPSPRGINRNRDVLTTQGAVVHDGLGINIAAGIAHPNPFGFDSMALVMANAIEPKLISRFTPTAQPSLTIRERVTLAPSVDLQFTHPPGFPMRPRSEVDGGAGENDFGPNMVVGPVGSVMQSLLVPNQPTTTIRVRSCGPVGFNSAGRPRGCPFGGFTRQRLVLTGTPGVPTLNSARLQTDGNANVAWTQSTGPEVRRFLVEVENPPDVQALDPACGLAPPSTTGGEPRDVIEGATCVSEPQPSIPPARYSFGAALRSGLVPAAAGQRVSVRECTDRGCGPQSAQLTLSKPLQPTLPSDFQLAETPIGLVASRVAARLRRGRTGSLALGWRAWKGWKALKALDVVLYDDFGTLARLRLDPRSGEFVLRGRGARSRRGTAGGRERLESGTVSVDTRRMRLIRTPASAAFDVPLRFSKKQRAGTIEVRIGATAKSGRVQVPRQTSTFELE